MFGRRKRQGEVEKFNSLNPLCATIFHELENELFKASSVISSEQCFSDEKVRNQLYQDYANSRAAKNEPGVEKAIENIVMQIIDELLGLEAEHGQKEYAELCGMAAAISLMRQIVFGFAPGLSSNGPTEAHEITVRILFILTRMFANKTPKTFQFGAGNMCSLFGVRCHELQWSRLAESDRDIAVSMWFDGYEVGQIEQTKAIVKVDDYLQQNNSIDKDDRDAARLYKLAAGKGNAKAQAALTGLIEKDETMKNEVGVSMFDIGNRDPDADVEISSKGEDILVKPLHGNARTCIHDNFLKSKNAPAIWNLWMAGWIVPAKNAPVLIAGISMCGLTMNVAVNPVVMRAMSAVNDLLEAWHKK